MFPTDEPTPGATLDSPVPMFSAPGHRDTVWSDIKGTVAHSNVITWTGGAAATHTIVKISGAAEVRTHSLGLHFSWNSGVAEAEAQSGKRVLAYQNRPRYGLILPAGTNVEFRIKEKSNYRFLAIEFEHEYLLRAAELQRLDAIAFMQRWEHDDSLTWHLATAIFEECESTARQGILYFETAATLLALQIVRGISSHTKPTNFIRRGGLTPVILRRVCDYMVSHLSEDVSLSELAAVCGLSIGHFAFAFKQSMKISPHVWLRRQRIDAAKALLRNPSFGIHSIAVSTGFANQSAFGIAFRKETGMTPTAWRRLHWK